MSYTLASHHLFGAPPEKKEDRKRESLVELITDTTRTTIFLGNLAEMVQSKIKQQQADDRAHRAIKEMTKRLSEDGEAEELLEEGSLFLGGARKLLVFVGEKFVEYVARPVITFAIRCVMSLVQFALRALVTYVIEPVIAAIVGFCIANPITAAVMGALLVAGGGYYIWRKFFKDKTTEPQVTSKEDQVPMEPGDTTMGRSSIGGIAPTSTAPSVYESTGRPSATLEPTATYSGKLLMPTKEIKDIILDAAKAVGVDPGIMFAIASAESSFNPNADASRSDPRATAGGLFQFVDKTWRGMVAKYGGNNPGPGHGIRVDDKFNPRANAIMGALLMKESADLLTKANLPVNAGNIYMVHFLGPTAIKFLSAMRQNPNANAAAMFPQEASYNTGIFYDKKNGGRPRSLYEIYELMTGSNTKVSNAKAAAYDAAFSLTPTSTNIQLAEIPKATPGVALEKPVAPSAAPQQVAQTPESKSGNSGSVGGKADRNIVKGPGQTLIEVS